MCCHIAHIFVPESNINIFVQERNIFIRVTSCVPDDNANAFVNPSTLLKESAPTLFCTSLLGRGRSFFDLIGSKLMDPTRVKMGEVGNCWRQSDFVLPM